MINENALEMGNTTDKNELKKISSNNNDGFSPLRKHQVSGSFGPRSGWSFYNNDNPGSFEKMVSSSSGDDALPSSNKSPLFPNNT